MLILLGLLVGTVVFYWGYEALDYQYEGLSVISVFVSMGCAACLILGAISVPIIQYESRAEVKRYEVLKETIKQSRGNDKLSEIERASLTKEIAEYNKDLAAVKFYNDGPFDVWYADELAELDYLK